MKTDKKLLAASIVAMALGFGISNGAMAQDVDTTVPPVQGYKANTRDLSSVVSLYAKQSVAEMARSAKGVELLPPVQGEMARSAKGGSLIASTHAFVPPTPTSSVTLSENAQRFTFSSAESPNEGGRWVYCLGSRISSPCSGGNGR